MVTYGKRRSRLLSALSVFHDSEDDAPGSFLKSSMMISIPHCLIHSPADYGRLTTAEATIHSSNIHVPSDNSQDELSPLVDSQSFRPSGNAFYVTSTLDDTLTRSVSTTKPQKQDKSLPALPDSRSRTGPLTTKSTNLKMPKMRGRGRSPKKIDPSLISDPLRPKTTHTSHHTRTGLTTNSSSLPRSTSAIDFSHFFKSSTLQKNYMGPIDEEIDPLAFNPDLVKSVSKMKKLPKASLDNLPKKNKAVLTRVKDAIMGHSGLTATRDHTRSKSILIANADIGDTQDDHEEPEEKTWDIDEQHEIYPAEVKDKIKASPKLQQVLGMDVLDNAPIWQSMRKSNSIVGSPSLRRARASPVYRNADDDLMLSSDSDDPFTENMGLGLGLTPAKSLKKSQERNNLVEDRAPSLDLKGTLTGLINSGQFHFDLGPSHGTFSPRRTPSPRNDFTIENSGLWQHPNVMSFTDEPAWMRNGGYESHNDHRRDGMAMARSPLKKINSHTFEYHPERFKQLTSSFSTDNTTEHDDELIQSDQSIPALTFKRASDNSKRSSGEAGLVGSPPTSKKSKSGSPFGATLAIELSSTNLFDTPTKLSTITFDRTMNNFEFPSNNFRTQLETHAAMDDYAFPRDSDVPKRDSNGTLVAERGDSLDAEVPHYGSLRTVNIGKLRRPTRDRRASMPMVPKSTSINFSTLRPVNVRPPVAGKSGLAKAANTRAFSAGSPVRGAGWRSGDAVMGSGGRNTVTDNVGITHMQICDGDDVSEEDELSWDDERYRIGRAR